MISHSRVLVLTEKEYLDFEMKNQEKHEFVAGHVFSMVGVSQSHNLITLNIASALKAKTAGSACRVFAADMRVRAKRANAYYYPDVVVSCAAERDAYNLSQPRLIVEVLSPGTEAIDRREKMLAYQQIESLTEYVLVAQDRPHVKVIRRDPAGMWWEDVYEDPRAEVVLASIDAVLPMDVIYDGVELSRA
jgi:Uma2 family endonuclease